LDSTSKLPVLDLAGLEHGDLAGVGALLGSGFAPNGFAYLANHGIPQETIDKVFETGRAFFALPDDVKRRIEPEKGICGYVANRKSRVRQAWGREYEKPNEMEAFVIASDGVDYADHSQWLEEYFVPGFRAAMEELKDALLELSHKLLKAFAVFLSDGDEDALEHLRHAVDRPDEIDSGVWVSRINRYPPQPSIIPEEQFGIAPHVDNMLFTLLAIEAPGLEALMPEAEDTEAYTPVLPKPGCLVMNAGSMMEWISNDLIRAVPHRVINRLPNSSARCSIPFFFGPHMRSELKPLDQCVKKTGGEPKYPSVSTSDYRKQFVGRWKQPANGALDHEDKPTSKDRA